MKLNQDFGMAVDTILFLKKKRTDEYIQANEIAKSLKFSVGYLQKVIQALSRYGVVECKRGRVGGVRLRAGTVTLLDIWNITCGEMELQNPTVPDMKKPLRVFADAMAKTVIYRKTGS